MKTTPKSLRLQIGIVGRTNVGKSSFLNLAAGQDVAITSPLPGTTTDVVEKTMELLPVGPVVFLDTAGMDDESQLSKLRIAKTEKIFSRADVAVLVVEPNTWTDSEHEIVETLRARETPLVIVMNKIDLIEPTPEFLRLIRQKTGHVMSCSSLDTRGRDRFLAEFKRHLLQILPDDFIQAPPLIGDLIPKGGLAVLIVPIDFEAPKGRIILPQVQAIRDALDHGCATVVVRETEYRQVLEKLKMPPDLVVCDSQVVRKMVTETPGNVLCTTFSILLARIKADLAEMAKGGAAIHRLKSGDKILIAESCSHHAIEGDIGRVKIPKWLKEFSGAELKIDVCAGRDFPADLSAYRLMIQCGSCMLTRRETLSRLESAREAKIPLTNYGVAISILQGVVERVLAPFPEALSAYLNECQLAGRNLNGA